MALTSVDASSAAFGIYAKGHGSTSQPRTSSTSDARSVISDNTETEFEDDMSDSDDYVGRRSEDSYGKRSDTTISTFEELRTPASNDFKGFNFQLPHEEVESPKKIIGPTGPHLFRYSQQSSSQEHDLYLEWSPVDSPRRRETLTKQARKQSHHNEAARPRDRPLEVWTVREVVAWARAKGFDESLTLRLDTNDINGKILRELKFGDLKDIGIDSFGQRHQLWDEIKTLRGNISVPSTPEDYSNPLPAPAVLGNVYQERRSSPCSNPQTPEEDKPKSAAPAQRRARRALRPDDVISPAESASIVAIEQLLPKPHHCSKGENCSKWRKQQRQLARIAKEFPLELEQLEEANASPSQVNMRPVSEVVPSVVASSDLLGPGLPSLRLDEEVLRIVPPRDAQENVRQFISFQHLDAPEEQEEPTTPPFEMFPPLSPPAQTQAPHTNLSTLPKLTIPASSSQKGPLSVDNDRTVIRQTRTPVTAMYDPRHYATDHDIYRLGSPASAMDVPLTAIPLGPIARDESQSVPPDMRYGDSAPIHRSTSTRRAWEPSSPISRPKTSNANTNANTIFFPPPPTAAGIQRSSSSATSRQRTRHPSFAMQPLKEQPSQIFSPTATSEDEQRTPTATPPPPAGPDDINYAGWMKKRKTRMLRHEWHENHFRLRGTKLAMHRDSKTMDALEYIDVDEYAVACSSVASNKKLNAAFKSLRLGVVGGSKKNKDEVGAGGDAGGSSSSSSNAGAFSFQLVPATEKTGMFSTAMMAGKTHHFAVKGREERIDWMRELMLAKALKQKEGGAEVNVNGNLI